ncbi:hypothetical protein RND71_030913 [Anisodus tanguticus]|uniref:Uncharacterized protein n=1 Tax=Anisodus tanguticus TaxID=243964 RepID=A0AAE1RHB3_9SOLA|nr:hypothetical protein RND71_030913 [Anisodus tanguticus]
MMVQEHAGNEKSCVWHAPDFADGELKDELFCIRFASMEIVLKRKSRKRKVRRKPKTKPMKGIKAEKAEEKTKEGDVKEEKAEDKDAEKKDESGPDHKTSCILVEIFAEWDMSNVNTTTYQYTRHEKHGYTWVSRLAPDYFTGITQTSWRQRRFVLSQVEDLSELLYIGSRPKNIVC